MQHVVIDEGSSQVKVCWLNGKIRSKIIPSRLVEGQKLESSGAFHDGCYEVNGNTYTVAPFFDRPIRTNTRQYQTSEYNRVLVHEALRLAGFGGQDVTIYCTLPISDFFGERPRNDELIERKKENLLAGVENLAGHKLANIKKVVVWPEAIPAWMDLLINEKGGSTMEDEPDERYKIMIVDIGGTTTDMTIIDGNGGLQNFESARRGVFDVAESLKARLIKQFDRVDIEAHQLDTALREKTFANENISDLIEKSYAPVVRDIHIQMENFVDDSSKLDAVLYVGGGSSLMAKPLAMLYKGHTIIGDELSIARGILKKQINKQVIEAS